jgi:hypothetical protein
MDCMGSSYRLSNHSRNPRFHRHSLLIVMASVCELCIMLSLCEVSIFNNNIYSTENVLHIEQNSYTMSLIIGSPC